MSPEVVGVSSGQLLESDIPCQDLLTNVFGEGWWFEGVEIESEVHRLNGNCGRRISTFYTQNYLSIVTGRSQSVKDISHLQLILTIPSQSGLVCYFWPNEGQKYLLFPPQKAFEIRAAMSRHNHEHWVTKPIRLCDEQLVCRNNPSQTNVCFVPFRHN